MATFVYYFGNHAQMRWDGSFGDLVQPTDSSHLFCNGQVRFLTIPKMFVCKRCDGSAYNAFLTDETSAIMMGMFGDEIERTSWLDDPIPDDYYPQQT